MINLEDPEFDIHTILVLEILDSLSQKGIKQKIIFQKIAFLSTRRFKNLFNLLDFKKHKFGPYSESLANIVKQLKITGLIDKNENDELIITSKGKIELERYHQAIKETNDLEQDKLLETIIKYNKEDFIDFNTDEMLAFVYKSFPEYIEPSIKAESLDYKRIFLNLYNEGKIGVSKISELMNWSYEDTLKFIKNNTNPIILK